jgi:hypothetical protein
MYIPPMDEKQLCADIIELVFDGDENCGLASHPTGVTFTPKALAHFTRWVMKRTPPPHAEARGMSEADRLAGRRFQLARDRVSQQGQLGALVTLVK